jgi:hypothetical protein
MSSAPPTMAAPPRRCRRVLRLMWLVQRDSRRLFSSRDGRSFHGNALPGLP